MPVKCRSAVSAPTTTASRAHGLDAVHAVRQRQRGGPPPRQRTTYSVDPSPSGAPHPLPSPYSRWRPTKRLGTPRRPRRGGAGRGRRGAAPTVRPSAELVQGHAQQPHVALGPLRAPTCASPIPSDAHQHVQVPVAALQEGELVHGASFHAQRRGSVPVQRQAVHHGRGPPAARLRPPFGHPHVHGRGRDVEHASPRAPARRRTRSPARRRSMPQVVTVCSVSQSSASTSRPGR